MSAEKSYCSVCGREKGLAFEILEYLRSEGFAIAIWEIYDHFSKYSHKTIRRVLLDLKAHKLVEQPQRGYYSA